MKILLTLLLLIPSLGWTDVIWLSCQKYKSTSYKDGEIHSIDRIDNPKTVFKFDREKLTLSKDGDEHYDLDFKSNLNYKFIRKLDNGVTRVIFLNRYTHQIEIEGYFENKDYKTLIQYNCEIVDRVL